MRWMIGIDLRNTSQGATAFSRWLAQHASRDRFFATHVVEWMPVSLVEGGSTAPSENEVRDLAEEALAPLRKEEHFSEVGAILATAPEDGLIESCRHHNCDALVVGRRATTEGGGMVRLGRVARRLVRQLPQPVVVVPPDLKAESVGAGPIIVGVDLDEHGETAVRWGQQLAESLGRQLLIVHVVEAPSLGVLVPADVWDQVVVQAGETGKAAFERWCSETGLADLPHETARGAVAPTLAKLAADKNACMLVVGSRHLGTVERLFRSSIGSDLTAAAPVPVAVVPGPTNP